MPDMERLVVHCKIDPFDIYIGRKSSDVHFGNPFSHLKNSRAVVMVESREKAVEAFEQWLLGDAYKNVEQKRRRWILLNLSSLKGKVLGCWCAPKLCHGEVLVRLANKL